MKTLAFSEFYNGEFDDKNYELYFVRDSNRKAMYIGISRDSIWHRWFGGGTSHMDVDAAGKIYAHATTTCLIFDAGSG